MEVDDAAQVLVASGEQDDDMALLEESSEKNCHNEIAGKRTGRRLLKTIKQKEKTQLIDELIAEPRAVKSPREAEASDGGGGNEPMFLDTPLKQEYSHTDDDDEDDLEAEASRDSEFEAPRRSKHALQNNGKSSPRRQLLQSPPSDSGSSAAGDSLKRKRFTVRRSGSDEYLLGFDELSGNAKLVKKDPSVKVTKQPAKTVENTSISSTHEELVQSLTLSPQTTKKIKRSPSETDENSPKHSPRSQTSPIATPPHKVEVETPPKQEEPHIAKQHIVGDNEDSAEFMSVVSGTEISTSAAPGTPIPMTNKKPLSAKDDYYKKPFEYGWKRELVYRANMETSKDKADVYFITPGGKKLRTRSDIAPLLEGELTLDHFSFAREPLGVGPDLETVRSAKPSHRGSAATATLVAAPAPAHPGKRISKPKGPKGASPPPQGWTPTRALKTNNAALLSSAGSSKYSSSNPSTPPSSRVLSSSSHKSNKTKKHINDIENDLKQINDSIRNSRKHSSTSLDAAFQPNNVGVELAPPKSFATNFFANVSFAYDALLCILKYLKIHERPRAASVCKLWHLAAKDTSLWQTVRMKNSKISDWAGFAAALRRGETKHLDLRKMLFSNTKGDEMWSNFSAYIGTVYSLESIDLCRCSTKVVESLFLSNPQLRVLNALAINDESYSLENIDKLTHLRELRLRTCEPGTLDGELLSLQSLTNLAHLSLTSLLGLGTKSIEVLGELTNLRSLELGECGDFDSSFAQAVLPKLANLQRLRLENGQKTSCCTLEILDAVAKLEQLNQLEFVNFDIKPGFDDKLMLCTNISKLLIIPTYISQSATTNQIVLYAVQQIADTLKVFTWGVTVELLRVTALYVDQCEESTRKEKHHFDECIPVMKPVPGAPTSDSQEEEIEDHGPNAVPQIEILPLDKVESILGDNLMNTKFTIVKVPYQATCKQHLVE